MKRFVCLILLVGLLLSGCAVFGERISEPVTFYYLRKEYQHSSSDGVIASEQREAAGHRDDLSYLLALYLMGPSEEELRSPIPLGTNILEVERGEDSVTIRLSDTSATLTDGNFSLACACLTLTSMEITGCTEVTITSGSRSVTMNRENLILFDDSVAAITEESQ